MTYTLPNGKKFHEWMDAPALAWLRLNFPVLESEMVLEAEGYPVYENKEVIVSREFFTVNPDCFIFLSFVHGNDDAKDNGWVPRVWEGVKQNSGEHLAILKTLEKISNCKFTMNNDD